MMDQTLNRSFKAAIDRYNSWQDYATSEAKAKVQMDKDKSGYLFRVREYLASHRDTLADRITP